MESYLSKGRETIGAPNSQPSKGIPKKHRQVEAVPKDNSYTGMPSEEAVALVVESVAQVQDSEESEPES